ncbi:MAG TPA: hypothetical protein VFE25_00035 [Opitutaceae bacterium]|jgi:hypothetical protein|nr:hypothetical protein [Opitutaceae bacterium]
MVAFTLFHVVLSLVGIATGFAVAGGLLKSQRMDCMTSWFLWTTAATSLTGFLFPVHHIMPSHVLGVISLVVLAVTIQARYRARLAGVWRPVYAGGAVLAFYLNFFVLIAQAFAKVPTLKALAPTQTEPPFALAEAVALVAFAVLGVLATIRFRPAA